MENWQVRLNQLVGLMDGPLVIDDWKAWEHWVDKCIRPIVEQAIEDGVDGFGYECPNMNCSWDAVCPECNAELN